MIQEHDVLHVACSAAVCQTSSETVMGTGPLHSKASRSPEPDLRPYAGRWVALVNGRIAGIGLTAEEARTAAKLSRPKEEPEIRFVPEGAWQTESQAPGG
jgi:hypothetical protein